MPDKWAQYAQPAAPSDKWSQYAVPAPAPSDDRNDIQKSFDANTQINPSDSLLAKGLKSVVGSVGTPFVHPFNTISNLIPKDFATQYQEAQQVPKQSLASGIVTGLGQAVGTAALGAVGGEALSAAAPIASDVASGIRTAAIGDTNAAALRGLRVPASSPKLLSTIGSVEKARPYLAGANSLEDLQGKIPAAKAEIWSPYKQTVDTMGTTPVKGPDGMTTIGDLEQERLQLSALNRGLKQQLPDAIQLAQQKGMSAAELLDREKAVTSALDPELSKYGIDPQAIRQNFGAVSRIGQQVGGKATLLEKPQPYGLGKVLDSVKGVDIAKPSTLLKPLGSVFDAARDITAGRPLFKGLPTDVAIRDGFTGQYSKPDLGTFQPPVIKGLLGAPMEDLPLHDPLSEPQSPKMLFDAPVLPGKYPAGVAPANYFRFGDQPIETPEGATGINQQGVLRRRKQN